MVANTEVAAERQHAAEINMDRLLKELHEKKRWLDTVIGGLEKAVNSPDHHLIENAHRLFADGGGRRPKVDVGVRQQKMLASLASQVGNGRRRRGRAESQAA
jgi:hypothetical protein